MILQTKIPQRTIVFQDVILKLLDTWLLFKVNVTLDESPIKLDNLSESKMLPGCLV